MKQFEIGKKYTHGYAGDSSLFSTYEVVARTAQTVTVVNNRGEVSKHRINKTLSEYFKAESIYPLGQYSMAPILSA